MYRSGFPGFLLSHGLAHFNRLLSRGALDGGSARDRFLFVEELADPFFKPASGAPVVRLRAVEIAHELLDHFVAHPLGLAHERGGEAVVAFAKEVEEDEAVHIGGVGGIAQLFDAAGDEFLDFAGEVAGESKSFQWHGEWERLEVLGAWTGWERVTVSHRRRIDQTRNCEFSTTYAGIRDAEVASD
jgi:hypothetical protein